MKHLITLALTIVAINLACAQLPTTGNFIYSNYTSTNNTCSGNLIITAVNAASTTCVNVGSQSFNNSGFNLTSNVLTNLQFNEKSCASASVVAENTTFPCEGSCQNFGGVDLTCLYQNITSDATFSYGTFLDSNCTKSIMTWTNYTSANYCWASSNTTSFFPTSFVQSNRVLSYNAYPAANCNNLSGKSYTANSITCNSTCLRDPVTTTQYYRCSNPSSTYSTNSAKLIVSLILTFAMMLIMV